MEFYGKGVVWDKDKSRPLCRFTDGRLETTDPQVIEKLKEAGYEHGPEPEKTKKEIMAMLDEYGVKYNQKARKEELQELLDTTPVEL